MKKKIFVIVGIVVLLLVTAGLFTSYADSARVRNSVEPVHTDIVNIGLHFFHKDVRPMQLPVKKYSTVVA